MNIWTEKSVEYANQGNYLDELYKVYPIIPNGRRRLSDQTKEELKSLFDSEDNRSLIQGLLDLEVFPVKDSYVAFLKRDRASIDRNPETVNRIAGNVKQMGFEEMIERCTQPKETNRQIGPMFKSWIDKGVIGAKIYRDPDEFYESKGNAVFNGSDEVMKSFCKSHLGYSRTKGIDFIARFNDVYVVGESKFITDFGGHQNAQFEDAINTIKTPFRSDDGRKVLPIGILDGVLYIKNEGKLYKYLECNPDMIIVSALILREFLYSL